MGRLAAPELYGVHHELIWKPIHGVVVEDESIEE